MTEPVIQTTALTKMYGRVRGVAGLDLEVRPGEVFAFLGPNGAGKTTMIRLVLDLIRPTQGSLRVLGLDPRRDGVAVRRQVGYVPGDLRLYPRLTGGEFLDYFARLRGSSDPARIAALAEGFDLDLSVLMRSLSKGNRQKVGLLQAFMTRPRLLLLDEPTSGLDPLVQQEFGRLVRETVADGATVFLSSHVLSEAQHLADRVGIIRDGRMVAVEDIATLAERTRHHFEVRFAAAPAAADYTGIAGVRDVRVEGDVLHCTVEGRVAPLLQVLALHDALELSSHAVDLEDVFLAYYGTPAQPPEQA